MKKQGARKINFVWKRWGRFWAGTLSALMGWWFCFVATNFFREWTLLHQNWPGFPWLTIALVLLQFAMIPAGGFAAGLVCSFLWHPVADRVTCERWGAIVVLLLFTPILLLGPTGTAHFLLPMILVFPFALVPFHRGANVGFRYWHEGYWRNFVGLTNEWERDENEG